MRSEDTRPDDLPTGELPVVRPADPRVTIAGAEVAAEAAGISLPTPPPAVDPTTLLPHWTEEPTGQVPAILQREEVVPADPIEAIPAPVWREDETDYTLADEQFAQIIADPDTHLDAPTETLSSEPVAEAPRPLTRAERLRQQDQKLLRHRATRTAPEKDVRKATVVGVAAALALVVVFLAGPIPLAIVVGAAIAAGIAELFAAYRAAGTRPATAIGVLGSVVLSVASYLRGETAVPLVITVVVAASFAWFLFTPTRIDMLDGFALTIMGFIWIGVIGNYAILLISPVNFKHHHGLAFLFGAIAAAVANDTGALFIGKYFGSRKLAPTISSNKTVAGFFGGAGVSLVVCVVLLPMISPWTLPAAAALSVLSSLIAPAGDLFESLVKRSLGIKDMGGIMPGHGGLVDRIDSILFLLPLTYYLVHAMNLG